MTVKALRKQTHELIDKTDDQFLKIVHELLLSHQVSDQPLNYSPEELATIMRRREEMMTDKTKKIPFDESIRKIKAELTLKNC